MGLRFAERRDGARAVVLVRLQNYLGKAGNAPRALENLGTVKASKWK